MKPLSLVKLICSHRAAFSYSIVCITLCAFGSPIMAGKNKKRTPFQLTQFDVERSASPASSLPKQEGAATAPEAPVAQDAATATPQQNAVQENVYHGVQEAPQEPEQLPTPAPDNMQRPAAVSGASATAFEDACVKQILEEIATPPLPAPAEEHGTPTPHQGSVFVKPPESLFGTLTRWTCGAIAMLRGHNHVLYEEILTQKYTYEGTESARERIENALLAAIKEQNYQQVLVFLQTYDKGKKATHTTIKPQHIISALDFLRRVKQDTLLTFPKLLDDLEYQLLGKQHNLANQLPAHQWLTNIKEAEQFLLKRGNVEQAEDDTSDLDYYQGPHRAHFITAKLSPEIRQSTLNTIRGYTPDAFNDPRFPHTPRRERIVKPVILANATRPARAESDPWVFIGEPAQGADPRDLYAVVPRPLRSEAQYVPTPAEKITATVAATVADAAGRARDKWLTFRKAVIADIKSGAFFSTAETATPEERNTVEHRMRKAIKNTIRDVNNGDLKALDDLVLLITTCNDPRFALDTFATQDTQAYECLRNAKKIPLQMVAQSCQALTAEWTKKAALCAELKSGECLAQKLLHDAGHSTPAMSDEEEYALSQGKRFQTIMRQLPAHHQKRFNALCLGKEQQALLQSATK